MTLTPARESDDAGFGKRVTRKVALRLILFLGILYFWG